jgi:hypothetical protein
MHVRERGEGMSRDEKRITAYASRFGEKRESIFDPEVVVEDHRELSADIVPEGYYADFTD